MHRKITPGGKSLRGRIPSAVIQLVQLLVDFFQGALPDAVLNHPGQGENGGKDSQVNEKSHHAAVHPPEDIGRQEKHRGIDEEVYPGLLQKAPPIHLPDPGADGKAHANTAVQEGLESNRLQLTPHVGNQLRHTGVEASVPPGEGEQNGNHVANGNAQGKSPQGGQKNLFFHGIHLIFPEFS